MDLSVIKINKCKITETLKLIGLQIVSGKKDIYISNSPISLKNRGVFSLTGKI